MRNVVFLEKPARINCCHVINVVVLCCILISWQFVRQPPWPGLSCEVVILVIKKRKNKNNVFQGFTLGLCNFVKDEIMHSPSHTWKIEPIRNITQPPFSTHSMYSAVLQLQPDLFWSAAYSSCCKEICLEIIRRSGEIILTTYNMFSIRYYSVIINCGFSGGWTTDVTKAVLWKVCSVSTFFNTHSA